MEENKKNKISAYPLSFAQQRIWFLSKLESKSLSYNIGSLIVINEKVDIDLMQSVFEELIKKHEVLRTNFFETEQGEPVQFVHAEKKNKIIFYDLSDNLDKRKKRKEIIKENSDYFFDLNQDSLARICIIKTAEDRYDFLMVVHHIISDIWSLLLFGNEFFHLYNQKKNKGDKTGFEISRSVTQYRDYAAWQQSPEFFEKVKQEKKYWLEQLKGDLPILDLPTDRVRPFLQTYDIKTVTLEIGEKMSAGVSQVAKQNNVTVYVFLLAVFKVLLFKLTEQNDLIVGTYAANRDLPELDGVMGVFLNNLVLRSQIDSEEKFSDFLVRIKEVVLRAMENKDYPFEKLIEDLDIPRDMGRSPIFNTVFQMFTNDDRLKINFYGSRGEDKDVFFDNGTSQFDLTLKVFSSEEKIFLVLDYNTYLFKKKTVKKFLTYYQNLVETFIDDVGLKLSQSSVFPQEEAKRLLTNGKGNKQNIREESIISIFEKKAEEDSDKQALIFKNNIFTYQELNFKVNQTARYFLAKGIRQGDVVGLFLERSNWYLISLLALLKIGAVYIPLDIKQPKKRISFILEDSEAKFIINQSKNSWEKVSNIILEEKNISNFLKDNLIVKIKQDDLAYIIYTSGSTGEPKGVKIKHLALVNFVLSIGHKLRIKKERVLASTNVIFDIFFLEAIAPLCWGSEVFLLSDSERLDPGFIKKYIIEKEISLIQFTPSFLSLFFEGEESSVWLKSVRKVLVGGEAWGSNLLLKIQKNFSKEIYNLYGPSETTIWSSVADLSNSEKVYLGQALDNTDIYILDKNLKLCPVNVIGEIYIGGAGLAKAYTNREETNKKFITNPFTSGRLYRTGDLAKYLSNGEIEYCGRIDYQVKINGRRVELKEISSELKKITEVNDCLVMLDKEEQEKLVAYYTARRRLKTDFLHSALVEKLPEHMIPSAFVFFDKFPLTANGKINRRALLGRFPISSFSSVVSRGAEGEIEKKIASIWREVLNIEKVNVHDNFFQLGGNSLNLIQVYSRLQESFLGYINVAELFSYPSIYSLGKHLKSEKTKNKKEKVDYQKKANSLIKRVAIGKLSAEEAAKIFAKI